MGDTLYFHEDTTKMIITKLDASLQPVWYEMIPHSIYFEFDSFEDTLFFTANANSTFTLFDTTFTFGGYYRMVAGKLSPEGELLNAVAPEGSRNLSMHEFMLDNCNQLIVAGDFDGSVRFKNDTVSVSQTGIHDGLLFKIQNHQPAQYSFGPDTTACDSVILTGPEGYAMYYWNNEPSTENQLTVTESGEYLFSCVDEYGCWLHDTIVIDVQPGFTIDLGADTTIALHDTLILSLPDNFDQYTWSNGDTTNSVTLIGGQMGPGEWDFQVQVDYGVCSVTDTIRITVLSSISEFEHAGIKAYPNPVGDDLKIESQSDLKTIELINLKGEIIYQKIIRNPNELLHAINISSFQQGVYILKITTCNTTVAGRIIKL